MKNQKDLFEAQNLVTLHWVTTPTDEACVKCGAKMADHLSDHFTTDGRFWKQASEYDGLINCDKKAEVLGRVETTAEKDAMITDSELAAIESDYSDMVSNLAKPGEDIVETMSPWKADLLHMAVGVAGEAGELLDCVKKHVVYNKPLDTDNLIEEMGDLEFYMQGIRNLTEITRTFTLCMNMEKLTGDNGRYKEGTYSDKAAQERADKQGE